MASGSWQEDNNARRGCAESCASSQGPGCSGQGQGGSLCGHRCPAPGGGPATGLARRPQALRTQGRPRIYGKEGAEHLSLGTSRDRHCPQQPQLPPIKGTDAANAFSSITVQGQGLTLDPSPPRSLGLQVQLCRGAAGSIQGPYSSAHLSVSVFMEHRGMPVLCQEGRSVLSEARFPNQTHSYETKICPCSWTLKKCQRQQD